MSLFFKKFNINLIFCIFISLSILCQPSYAGLNDKKVVSWNLQGSSASTESKWSVNVREILLGNRGGNSIIDMILIQEAGMPPTSSRLLPQLTSHRFDNPDNLSVPVEEYEWRLGSSTRGSIYYIYFSRVDTGANRVNLAIVSRERADRVIILGTSSFLQGYGRPILGINVSGDYYFNIHAIANGGSDSGTIVERVWNYFNQNRNYSEWMIAGDFNRNPYGSGRSLQGLIDRNYPHLSSDINIISQNLPTQSSGGILNYTTVGQINRNPTIPSNINSMLFIPRLLGQLASDHYPVLFSKFSNKKRIINDDFIK